MLKSVAPLSSTLLKRKFGTGPSAVAMAWSSIRKFREPFRLAETPLIYQIAYRDVRRVVLRRFPYILWYRVIGEQVTVLACTHVKQDPGTAITRIQ